MRRAQQQDRRPVAGHTPLPEVGHQRVKGPLLHGLLLLGVQTIHTRKCVSPGLAAELNPI